MWEGFFNEKSKEDNDTLFVSIQINETFEKTGQSLVDLLFKITRQC